MQTKKEKNLQFNQTQMPHIPCDIDTLPPILKEMTALATTDAECDMLLVGTLTAVSACLPNLVGKYDRHTIYPHMYLFVSAPASAGKGCLNFCRDLVLPVHNQLRAEATIRQGEWETDKDAAAQSKHPFADPRPSDGGLLIQANSSATAFIQALHGYGGNGLMFETEGDTVAQAIKMDNYSDLLRKAFHHEDFGYIRRRNSESVYIHNPRLAILLSGTPAQIGGLIPTAENGLFSRFLYLSLSYNLEWKDVFAASSRRRNYLVEDGCTGDCNDNGCTDDCVDDTAEQTTAEQGARLLTLHNHLEDLDHPLHFSLDATQRKKFNRTFAKLQDTYAPIYGIDLIPTIRRLGLFSFRIAMVLSSLRLLEDNETAKPNDSRVLECSEADLALALHITATLVDHAARVYGELPRSAQEKLEERTLARPLSGAQTLFYDALPATFETADAVALARDMHISQRSCFNYLKIYLQRNLLRSPLYGHYEKPASSPESR